jgi:Dolichyl-phosphate-mannose-protein mannosyltransferase
VLAESPYPVGVDGFFYPIQVRALLAHGALQYPAAPLTFWWMAPFAALSDPITGAKLGAALGGALIAIPAWGVGARLGRNPGAGLVAAALAAGSAGSAYLSIEFVKQGLGLTVGLAALWLVLRALELRSRGRIAAALAGLVAALLTHKLAAALVVVVAAPAIARDLRGGLRGRRLIYAYLAAIGAALVLVVLGLVMPQRFVSASDFALIAHAFTTHAEWSAPALATHGFVLTLEHEALIGGLVALAAGGVLMRSTAEPRAERTVGIAFVVLGIVLAIPWLEVADPQGLAFRARTAAFVPLAMCAAIVAGALARWIAGSLGRRGGRLAAVPVAPAVLVVLAAVLSLRAAHERREGRILAHPALVAAAIAASDQIPANATVIVPERHIEYMVAWFSRRPVSLRPESIPYAQRVRLMPLAFMSPELQQAIDAARAEPSIAPPIGLHPRHRNGLVLVEEPTWDWILARLPGPLRRHYARWPTI